MGKILATARALILIISMIIFISFYLLSLIFTKNSLKRTFRLRRNWVRLSAKVLGIKLQVAGKVYDKPALYVCNHRSFSDPVITSIFLDAFVIAKAEVAQLPIIDKGARLTGVVYVKRDDNKSRQATREKMVELLASGQNVLVFPEGTTGGLEGTKEFKKGTFHEAAKLKIPVVPIALEYRDEKDMWKSGGLFGQYFRQYSKISTYAKMSIGSPIANEDGEELCNSTQSWIDNELAKMQRNWTRVQY